MNDHNQTEKPNEMEVAKPASQGYLVDAKQQKTDYFDPIVWQQMKGMSDVFRASGALPETDNASMIMMKLQAGREMGLKPIESIKAFYFVKGSLNIFGSAMMRRLREHGWRIEYKEAPNKCTAIVSRGDEIYRETFTFEEAEKSGWTESQYGLKPGWIDGANRRVKLRYAAVSLILKTYIPEVLGSAVDLVEVAEDVAPLLDPQEPKIKDTPQLPDGDKSATESTLASLRAMDKGLVYFDEDGGLRQPLTKQEATDALASLLKGGNQ